MTIAIAVLMFAAAEAERPRVVATLPVVASIVGEVAGEDVVVEPLARPDENPHFVQPTPLLMRRARDARALFEIGMMLEAWADEVARASGNPNIQRGTPGRVILSAGVPAWEVPARVGREQGDIHPQGNPYIWLDPVRAKLIARNAAEALAGLFPEHADDFRRRLADFEQRINVALYGEDLIRLVGVRTLDRYVLAGTIQEFLDTPFRGAPLRDRAGGWLARAASLRGVAVVEYHKTWVYVAKLFGMDIAGTVEPYPGIPPGPAHIQALMDTMPQRGVRLVLLQVYYSRESAEAIAGRTGARIVVLPTDLAEGVDSYTALMDRIVERLTQGLDGSSE